jgi:hypothetical protein
MRLMILLTLLALTARGIRPAGPAGEPSSTNVNPETGQRGGTSSSSSHR